MFLCCVTNFKVATKVFKFSPQAVWKLLLAEGEKGVLLWVGQSAPCLLPPFAP
jgi:hypothetical protein